MGRTVVGRKLGLMIAFRIGKIKKTDRCFDEEETKGEQEIIDSFLLLNNIYEKNFGSKVYILFLLNYYF